MDAFFLSIL